MKHHGAGLRRLTKQPELVEALIGDFRAAPLGKADQEMLAYAAKLTREPWTIEESDVISLRDVGFSDQAILDINQVTAYYAFVNRLADGLGVEVESFWEDAS